jgi:hypothetical protein
MNILTSNFYSWQVFGGTMGRKGVSKRKPTKAKNPSAPAGNSSGAVSSIARLSETPAVQPFGKTESSASSKGGKKK